MAVADITQSKLLRDFEPTTSLANHLLSPILDRTPLEPDFEELLWHICDYSWLVSSNRPEPKTVKLSPTTNKSPDITATLELKSGDTPDFDTLLEGALSLDYSLLDNIS